MRALAPSVAQFGTTKHACPFDGVGSGGDQDPSQVSVRIPCRTPTLPCRRIRTSQGGRRLPATVVPYMQCMPCNARIACMARATRMPRNACVTCSDRKAILPRKIASTCENQISGSDAPQHCGTHDRATRPQACERVGIRDGSFRRDYAPRRPLFNGLGGFSPSKAGSSAMHRPKYRPPDSQCTINHLTRIQTRASRALSKRNPSRQHSLPTMRRDSGRALQPWIGRPQC